jgi:hypothetical protein
VEPDGGNNPPLPKAKAPVAIPGAGNAYTANQDVTLSTTTEDAVIYYTVNGDNPTAASTAYDVGTPVTVSPGATLKAVAVKDGFAASDVMAITYINAAVFTYSGTAAITITGYTGGTPPKDLVIPGAIDGTPVTAIYQGAFGNKGLESVTIPDSVITIAEGAFQNNKLTGVTIPDSVITIKSAAFYSNQIENVAIGNSVEYIETAAFGNNKLTGVTIPDSVTTIENSAFYGNQLESVTIPDLVTTIGSAAFNGNPLTSVTMPANVTTVDGSAFPGNLATFYTDAGKAAGTYTRANDSTWGWAKSE